MITIIVIFRPASLGNYFEMMTTGSQNPNFQWFGTVILVQKKQCKITPPLPHLTSRKSM